MLGRAIGGIKAGISTLVLGVVGIAVCLANIANVSDVMKHEEANGTTLLGAGTTFEIGLFIVLIATVTVIIASILMALAGRRPRA